MKRVFIVSSVVLFFLFGLLSKYEDRAFIRNLDFAVTVRLQERIDRSSHLRAASVVGNLMEGATFFASPEFISIATICLTGLLLYDRKTKRWHLSALIIPLALIVLVLIEIYSKSVVHHPAPVFSMIKNPTTIFPANYINEQFSYPSGHAARGLFIAVIAGIWFIRGMLVRKGAVMLTLGLLGGYVMLVSISRIYLGHHWFSDVAGGWLLGGACGIVYASFRYKKNV